MTATVAGSARIGADLSDAALAWITGTLTATAAHYDATAKFPWEPFRAVYAAGLLTLGVAPQYGGQEVEIEAQLAQAGEVLYSLAGRIDVGDPDAVAWAGVAKLLVTRSPIAVVRTAVATFGNLAITGRNPLERIYATSSVRASTSPAGRRHTARRRTPRAAPSSS